MDLKAVPELMRIPNDIFIGIAVIIGMVISLRQIPSIDKLISGFFSGFFISASVMIANDIVDLEIDRINNPKRPLPSNRITITQAKILVFLFIVLGLWLSITLNFYNFLIAVIFWFLGIIYNKYLKKTGILGNLIVSASVAIPFIYGSVGILGYPTILSMIFATLAFLSNTGREIIKGIIDLRGDKTFMIKTLAVTKGASYAGVIASILIIASVALSPLPLLISKINIFYYLPLVLVTDIVFLYAVFKTIKLIKIGKYSELIEIKKLLFVGMGFGLLAFLLGAYFV